MRLPFGLISTFLLLSSLSFLPSVFATRRRHSKGPKDAIIASRQWHPQPVARALLDVCVNLSVVLPPSLKQLLTGNVDLCLCLKDLDIFLDVKVKDLGVLGGLLDVPRLRILLNGLFGQYGKECSLPDHAHFVCTNSDPCHFACDKGFTRVGDQCVCAPPNKLCQGQCLPSPNACDPSAVPRSLRSRRNEITTLNQAQKYCGSKSVCGLPSGQGFECVDTENTVDSCGGCVYPNPWDTATSGRNCATPHALKAACRQSQCVVDLCQDGFAPNDARDACVAIHRKRLTPASHELLRLRTLDYPEFDALPSDLNVRRSSLCPPPSPTIPASPPTTQNGLLDLIVDLHTLGKKIDSLGGTLSDKCNCHDSPSHPSPHNPAPMLKSVVTLSLKVDAKLGDLSNNPANIDSVVVLLGQLLNASDKCLALPGLVGELENIIVQLKDVVGRLLKGLQLLSSGVKQCGCKAGLISSLKGGLALKRGFAFRRGVACTDIHKRDIVDSRGLVDGLVKGLGLGDILSPVDNPAGSVSTVSTTTTGPSEGSSCGPCIGPDGQPDPTAPVDVDLTCLLGLGLDADVIADLGPGLNMPLNEVSNSLLGNGVHPSNVIHPCLKCSGGNGGGGSGSGSGSATGTGSEATMTTSDCTSSPSSPAGHPTPTGTSVGIPPPSQPTGSTGGNSGSGASSNTAIPTSSAPTPHSSVVVTTRSSAPSSSPTVGTGTGGSSGSGSGNSDPTGPCVDSNGQPDPTAPVDVDLTCLLGIPGIDVDVALNLESLNVPLNQLHKLVGDGVHPSNVIHPCLKCTGGGGSGSGSGSGSGPSTTLPTGSSSTSGCSEDGPPATATPVTPPNTNGPKSGDGKCGQGSGDSTNAVVVDLTPIGIDAVATVDLGCSINKLLNDLLDPLDPIVHAAPSRRSGSGSPSVEGVKAALNATVNFGSAISGTAETLYGSCGCKGEPHSPILLTVAVSATLKKSIDDLQKNPTVETATAALNAAKALLETAQSCEALPGLKAQVIALIHSLEKDCQGLIPQLEYLVGGLQTCGCGKELKL